MVVDWIGSVGVVVGWKGGKSGGRLLLCRVKGGLAVRVRPLYPLLGLLSDLVVFLGDRDWNWWNGRVSNTVQIELGSGLLASRMFWHQPCNSCRVCAARNGKWQQRPQVHVAILVRLGLE